MLTIEDAKKLKKQFETVWKHELVIDTDLREAVGNGKHSVSYNIEDDPAAVGLITERYKAAGWHVVVRAFEPDRVGRAEIVHTITITFPQESYDED